MKLIFLAILISLTAMLSAVEERVGIDPILRGLWRLHVSSTDGGTTLVPHNPPVDLAVVTATAMNMGADGRYTFERVLIVHGDDGNPGNMVLLDTGRWLAITKTPGQEFVLVQVYEIVGDVATEHNRWVVTVHQ